MSTDRIGNTKTERLFVLNVFIRIADYVVITQVVARNFHPRDLLKLTRVLNEKEWKKMSGSVSVRYVLDLDKPK